MHLSVGNPVRRLKLVEIDYVALILAVTCNWNVISDNSLVHSHTHSVLFNQVIIDDLSISPTKPFVGELIPETLSYT